MSAVVVMNSLIHSFIPSFLTLYRFSAAEVYEGTESESTEEQRKEGKT